MPATVTWDSHTAIWGSSSVTWDGLSAIAAVEKYKVANIISDSRGSIRQHSTAQFDQTTVATWRE